MPRSAPASRPLLVALAAAITILGCGDGPNAPRGAGLDPAAVDAATGALAAVIQQPAFVTLQQYGFPELGAATAASGATGGTAAAPSTATVLAPVGVTVASDAAGALIPAAIRGRVYVWRGGGLVHDPAILGAPTDGIRVVLRPLDAAGRPTGEVAGYVDLRDSSGTHGSRLAMTVLNGVGSAATVAYRGRIGETTDGVATIATVAGTATDGRRQVAFTQTVTTTGTGAAERTVTRWTLDAPGLTAEGEEAEPVTATDVAVWTLRVDGRTLRFARGAERQPDGRWEASATVDVTLDGQPWATYDPGQAGGAWRTPDGAPLTGAQADTIARVVVVLGRALPIAFLPHVAMLWLFAIRWTG